MDPIAYGMCGMYGVVCYVYVKPESRYMDPLGMACMVVNLDIWVPCGMVYMVSKHKGIQWRYGPYGMVCYDMVWYMVFQHKAMKRTCPYKIWYAMVWYDIV